MSTNPWADPAEVDDRSPIVIDNYQNGAGGEKETGIELEPPEKGTPRFGVIGDLWKEKRLKDKRRRYLGKGYVQWFLIDEAFPRPRLVKPERTGGGIPSVTHDGERYFFPREAMIPAESNGFWTIFHQKGDAEPLNIREPKDHVIPADAIKRWADMEVSTDPPGWLNDLFGDMTPQELFRYGLIVIIGYAILRNFLSGGGFF